MSPAIPGVIGSDHIMWGLSGANPALWKLLTSQLPFNQLLASTDQSLFASLIGRCQYSVGSGGSTHFAMGSCCTTSFNGVLVEPAKKSPRYGIPAGDCTSSPVLFVSVCPGQLNTIVYVPT